MSTTLKRASFALILGMAAVVAYGQSAPPPSEGGSQKAVEFIKGLDKNDDGVLSIEEVADTPLKADFPDIDADGDGKLTAAELAAFTPKNPGG